MDEPTHCNCQQRSKPRIAWLALVGLFLVLAVAAFADSGQVEAAAPLLQTLAYSLTGVILIDVGGCAAPEVIRDIAARR